MSKIEPHRRLVEEKWRSELSINQIHKMILALGTSVARETLRKWIVREVSLTRLPSRRPANSGRKPRNDKGVSLGILSYWAQPKKRLRPTLIFLMHSFGLPIPHDQALLVCKELGIPSVGGVPCLDAYAKMLGKRRILTFGDLDFYALAYCLTDWQTILRNDPFKGPIEYEHVLDEALKLKRRMLLLADAPPTNN